MILWGPMVHSSPFLDPVNQKEDDPYDKIFDNIDYGYMLRPKETMQGWSFQATKWSAEIMLYHNCGNSRVWLLFLVDEGITSVTEENNAIVVSVKSLKEPEYVYSVLFENNKPEFDYAVFRNLLDGVVSNNTRHKIEETQILDHGNNAKRFARAFNVIDRLLIANFRMQPPAWVVQTTRDAVLQMIDFWRTPGRLDIVFGTALYKTTGIQTGNKRQASSGPSTSK